MIHAAFVMEQHIGHKSFFLNLRRFIEEEKEEVQAAWIPVDYVPQRTFWLQLPGLSNLVGTLSGRRQARAGLQNGDYDIAFFNTQVPAVLAGNLTRKQPYVLCTDITPRQYDVMAEPYGHKPDRPDTLLARYKHWQNTNLFQNAACTIGWSTWVGDSLRHDYGVCEANIRIIPPGIDTTKWHPAPAAERDRPRILFVGGDLQRKGGDSLLRVFRQLPESSVELVLVTRTPVDAPNVEVHYDLAPNSPELIALYQSCDIFVLPTKAEAFGIATLEAGATGLPIVVTAVGGLTDVVMHGETGFLIEPGNDKALYSHLKILIDDPALRHRMGTAARARVLDKFDARTNAGKIVNVLRETVATQGAGDLTSRTNMG